MNLPKNPNSFRRQLNGDQYSNLSLADNLNLLDIINGKCAGDRELAKTAIWNAHLRQVNSELETQVTDMRRMAGLSVEADRINSDAVSEMFNDVAAAIHRDMSDLAESCYPGCTISGLIKYRVCCRIRDTLRGYYLQRNTTEQDKTPVFVGLNASGNQQVGTSELTALINKMTAEEILNASKQLSLDDTAKQILSIVDLAINRREQYDVTMLATRLGIPVTTARSAYSRALIALREMFASREEP